jgi:hypothetical protein
LQLVASIYMYFGTQFTNHSVSILFLPCTSTLTLHLQGILGAGVVVPSYTLLKETSELDKVSEKPIAHLRHQSLSSVKQLMLDRVEQLDIMGGTADEGAERLLLSWMALDALTLTEDGPRHDLLGELVHLGRRLAESSDLGNNAAGMLDFALQGLLVRSCLVANSIASLMHSRCSAVRSANQSFSASPRKCSFPFLLPPPFSLLLSNYFSFPQLS